MSASEGTPADAMHAYIDAVHDRLVAEMAQRAAAAPPGMCLELGELTTSWTPSPSGDLDYKVTQLWRYVPEAPDAPKP